MGSNFFGGKAGAADNLGSKRRVVGENFRDSRRKVSDPGVDKADDETRVFVILVHELRNVKFIVIVAKQGEVALCPKESELVMDEVKALDLSLDDKPREDGIYFEGAAPLDETIKVNKVNILRDFIRMAGGESGEDNNMPIWIELGKGGDIVNEDFFGAADRKLGREEKVVRVLTDLGNKTAVERSEIVKVRIVSPETPEF